LEIGGSWRNQALRPEPINPKTAVETTKIRKFHEKTRQKNPTGKPSDSSVSVRCVTA
jgi:hypothetical protein